MLAVATGGPCHATGPDLLHVSSVGRAYAGRRSATASRRVADLVRALAEVVQPRELRERLEAENPLEERRRPVADRAAGPVLAARLGDQPALDEAGDDRVGGDAADPRDLRPADRPEVGDDRQRLERRRRQPPLDRPLERAARRPRQPLARRGTPSRRRRARARSRCAPRRTAPPAGDSAVSIRSASSSAATASSSTDSGCDATTSSASSVRASRSTGLAVIRRSGRSIRPPLVDGLGPADPDRRERRRLLERDLARAAQLEQGQERDRLLDSRQPRRPPRRGRRPCAARAAHGTARGTATRAGSAARGARARPTAARRPAAAARPPATRAPAAPAAARPAAQRRRPEPEEPVALTFQPLREPGRSLLRAPVLGQPARQLLRRLLGLELGELGLLVREQPTRLQLEQGRDEDEELAAGLEVELAALREPLARTRPRSRPRPPRPGRAPPSAPASGAGRTGLRRRRGPARARARPRGGT